MTLVLDHLGAPGRVRELRSQIDELLLGLLTLLLLALNLLQGLRLSILSFLLLDVDKLLEAVHLESQLRLFVLSRPL